MILNQFGRRNLPAYQRTKLALRLEAVIAKRAKENLQATGRAVAAGNQGCQISDNLIKPVDTKKEIAKIAGVSNETWRR